MHCAFSFFIPLPFLIVSAASHTPCLVSFFPLQAFCSANSHSSAYCRLPAATVGPLSTCGARGSPCLHWNEKWDAEAGGNTILECPPLLAVKEGQQEGGDLLPPQKSL